MDYKIKGETLAGIADAIRSKTGTEDTMIPSEMPAAIEDVYEAGQKSEYDAFWDVYQTNGTANNYAYVFAGRGWNSKTYHPKYPLDTGVITNCAAMYLWSGVSEIGSVNFENATSFNVIFQGCQLLTTIEGIKFPPADMYGTFDMCYKLKNITVLNTIVGNINFKDCPLTGESILSVLEHLATVPSTKTITFNKAAVDSASTDAAWLAEYNALVKEANDEKNWSITLS